VNFVTPDPADFDEVCRVLIIPAGYAPCVMGALAELAKPYRWEVGVDSIDDAVNKMADMIDAAYESECVTMAELPNYGFFFWEQYKSLTGNALFENLSTSQEFNVYWRQNAPAINDEVVFEVLLNEGTYDLLINGVTAGGGGIQHWFVDGVEQATTIDMYQAVSTFNKRATISITVIGSGAHELKCKMSSKNASSSNYRNDMTWVKLVRTGD
jgi:hypothetical protein